MAKLKTPESLKSKLKKVKQEEVTEAVPQVAEPQVESEVTILGNLQKGLEALGLMSNQDPQPVTPKMTYTESKSAPTSQGAFSGFNWSLTKVNPSRTPVATQNTNSGANKATIPFSTFNSSIR